MQSDHSILLEDISSLLAAQPGAARLAAIEDTLTAGYARAMALEAERWRLERRMGEVARELDEDVETRADELARLATRVRKADGDLSHLRTLLGSLHDRARELRAATA